MRHEVIKLTAEAIYPRLINLLEGNGELIHEESIEFDPMYKHLKFDGEDWTQYNGKSTLATITDVQFLQKYGNTDQPDKDFAWKFKTDEELAMFLSEYETARYEMPIVHFIKSKRKPAFELVTADNVKITNEYQSIFLMGVDCIDEYEAGQCVRKNYDRPFFSTREAALTHRHQNTPAIKLSDMAPLDDDCYIIKKDKADKLVNERINGTK